MRLLFARIGWMRFYAGSTADDERPVGGGAYNKTDEGHEILNFLSVNGLLYGYVEANEGLNLERIQSDCEGSDVNEVLVIFFAADKTRPPGKRQVIIGWYKNAKVFRTPRVDRAAARRGKGYNLVAKVEDAVLLPLDKRSYEIPRRRKTYPGQSNVTYALSESGEPLNYDWIAKVIEYVRSYAGENLLIDPVASLLVDAEVELSKASGYQSNKKIQLAVERRAMSVATKFYESLGYVVQNVSTTRSWDLSCTDKDGSTTRVEVKGLQDTSGTRIILTSNEVREASDSKASMELFVVYGIAIEDLEKPVATGGLGRRYANWNPQQHKLRATQYLCELNPELGSQTGVVS